MNALVGGLSPARARRAFNQLGLDMRIFQLLAVMAAALVISGPSLANINVARSTMPDAELAGEARMRVFVWNVYDAALFAPEGEYRADEPFALSLSYLRAFTADQIIDRTMVEIEQQPGVDPARLPVWRAALAQVIPDVERGVTITGLRDGQGYASFYRGEELLGVVEDAEFSRRFFDIWLGENTSNPSFRQALLQGDTQ